MHFQMGFSTIKLKCMFLYLNASASTDWSLINNNIYSNTYILKFSFDDTFCWVDFHLLKIIKFTLFISLYLINSHPHVISYLSDTAWRPSHNNSKYRGAPYKRLLSNWKTSWRPIYFLCPLPTINKIYLSKCYKMTNLFLLCPFLNRLPSGLNKEQSEETLFPFVLKGGDL